MKSIRPLLTMFAFISTISVAIGEKVPFSLLRRLLPENPIILEAGAQRGEDTAWMSELWPNGKIYSFEPNPIAYQDLIKLKKNNVFPQFLALSDKSGEFPFYLAGGASSLLCPTPNFNRDYFHADINNPIMVNVVTLNEWSEKNNVSHIDFMWLDMEGNELFALQGASLVLPYVKVIYTEVNLQKFWQGCVLYKELKAWLEGQGFEEVWQDIAPDWHGNVLFVKR